MPGPKRPRKADVDAASAALDQVRHGWMRRPGVTAVDVGFKISDGQLTDEVALRVHVERKRPVSALAAEDVFNDGDGPNAEVDGFPVDVIEADYAPSGTSGMLDLADPEAVESVNRKSVVTPLLGGISCANERVTAGTLGSIVFDTDTGDPMILSNWHVLAGDTAAAVGESIIQPGRLDGGTAANRVATLTRMELDSRMDAAVATLDGSRAHTRDILGLDPISGMSPATLGTTVTKSGRTTGITTGVIDGVSMSVAINYRSAGRVNFTNQIRIVPLPPWPAQDIEISRGGDSGSVWMTEGRNAVGLHFAGETNPAPTAENAICSPIEPIAQELRFSFSPVIQPPQPPAPPEVDIWRRLICLLFPSLCSGSAPSDREAAVAGAIAQALTGPTAASPQAAPARTDAEMLEAIRQLLR
ncbi:MAG: hypothetical protein AAGA99_01770 [Actinomycetota bacterium]